MSLAMPCQCPLCLVVQHCASLQILLHCVYIERGKLNGYDGGRHREGHRRPDGSDQGSGLKGDAGIVEEPLAVTKKAPESDLLRLCDLGSVWDRVRNAADSCETGPMSACGECELDFCTHGES